MSDQGTPPDPDAEVIEATPAEIELLGLAGLFREFADQLLTRLPLYRRLCEGVASDLFVVDRLRLARPDQRIPNLMLAAVHDVLLAGEDDPLADWYPSVVGLRGDRDHAARPVGHGADDPWPHFRRLVLEHPGVEERLRTRATQTNEVGRSSLLLPALFAAALDVSKPPGGIRPIGLVEVGASAGLNLRPDAYGYRYHLVPPPSPFDGVTGTRTVVESVGPGSRLMLDCQLRGERIPPLPAEPLPVATAVGIDRHPVRVDRLADARWLVACQWPEETERLDRLRAAIDLAAGAPPTVEEGDAVADLARHVLAVPGHALPVVVATWVLTYLTVAEQRSFMDELDVLGGQRDLALVFAEQPERVPGVPIPPRPDGQPDGRATAVVRMGWRDGERVAVRLADAHPHGSWLEWLDA